MHGDMDMIAPQDRFKAGTALRVTCSGFKGD